jgi:ankyrin repeat protein
MFPCNVPDCSIMLTRKDNITKHLKHNHPDEFKAQRQKISRDARPHGNDTTEASDSPLTEPQITFDWWHSARTGHIPALESMLNTGFDINSQAGDGNTGLHCAAHANQVETVDYLLRKGARLDVKNKRFETALFEAAVGGSSECISRLLEAKMTVSYFSPSRWGPRLCFVDHVVRIGNVSLVEGILNSYSLTTKESISKPYAFAVAAAKVGQIQIIRSILNSHLVAFTLPPEGRRLLPPIYYAVKNRQMQALDLLLKDEERISIEHARLLVKLAARQGYLDILQILLKRFPDSIAPMENHTSILHEAAIGGNLETVHYLLSIPSIVANIDSKDMRLHTALYFAAKQGHVRILQALLNANADPGMSHGYEYQDSPLMAAFWNGGLETLRILSAYSPLRLKSEEDGLEVTFFGAVAQRLLEIGQLFTNIPREKTLSRLLNLSIKVGDISLAKLALNYKDLTPLFLNNERYTRKGASIVVSTSLDFARERGRFEIADLLIAHDAIGISQYQGLDNARSEQQPLITDESVETEEPYNSDYDSDLEAEPYSYVEEYISPHSNEPHAPAAEEVGGASKRQRLE